MNLSPRHFCCLLLLSAAACALSGPRLLASNQSGLRHIAVDLSHVYWTTSDGRSSTLMKVSREEKQTPIQVTTMPGTVQALAVDDDGLYLVIGGGERPQDLIRRIPKKKAPPTDLAVSPSKITSIALDATHVYWTQTGDPANVDDTLTPGVLRVMRMGGTPLNLAPHQPGNPCEVSLSATHVYWVNSEANKQYTILGLRKAGGAPLVLAIVPDIEAGGIPALAADDAGVYYKTRTSIMKLASEGGPAQRVASVPDSDPSQLAFDGRALYFLSPRGPMRLGLQGAQPALMAEGPGSAIAVDNQAVYWLSTQNVMLVPKQ